MSKGRRQAIRQGLICGLSTLLPYEFATAQSSTVNAAAFANGALKGFQADNVRARGNNASYFDALAATGANVARVFFSFGKCQACTQFGRAPGDIDALHRILEWASTRKLKIVVAGDFTDSDKPAFWLSTDLKQSVVENWRWFAKEFGNHPALAGLDLLNEPNPPWQNGKVAGAQELWRPVAERAIAAIRAEGFRLPIIFEGVGGGSAIGFRDLLPFDDPQVVYSLHVYTPHDITHQGVGPAWSRKVPYPAGPEWQLKDAVLEAGGWDRMRLQSALEDVVIFQQRHKRPIFVGEFSCVRWAPNGSAQRYVADCLAIFKQHGWSWCYHDFRGWPGWDSEIDSESTQARARSEDAPIISRLRSEMTSNKR